MTRSRWWLGLAGALLVVGVLAFMGRAAKQGHKPPDPVPIAVSSVRADSTATENRAALCANEPFYKRSWCLHKACQRPGMSKVAACIAERKHREDAAKAPQPY